MCYLQSFLEQSHAFVMRAEMSRGCALISVLFFSWSVVTASIPLSSKWMMLTWARWHLQHSWLALQEAWCAWCDTTLPPPASPLGLVELSCTLWSPIHICCHLAVCDKSGFFCKFEPMETVSCFHCCNLKCSHCLIIPLWVKLERKIK